MKRSARITARRATSCASMQELRRKPLLCLSHKWEGEEGGLHAGRLGRLNQAGSASYAPHPTSPISKGRLRLCLRDEEVAVEAEEVFAARAQRAQILRP